MKTLLIVYHTQTGNTLALARAAELGAVHALAAESDAGRVVFKHAQEAGLVDLLNADGLIIASPENFGYMAGMIKDFLDRTFYPAEPYQLSLPYTLLISAGNDGRGAVRELDRIMGGYPMRKVMDAHIARGEIADTDLADCQAIGEGMMTAILMGAF